MGTEVQETKWFPGVRGLAWPLVGWEVNLLSHFGKVEEKDSRALKGSFNINEMRYFHCNFF